MDTLKLEANYRTDMSKSRTKSIRREGYATASVFGHDAEPVPIEVKVLDIVTQTKQSETGLKSIFDLKINGAPKKSDGMVIIKEFHKHALTRKVLDIQFQRINLKEKIHVGVPIELVGEAAGVKEGGIVEQMLDELQVNCLPIDIPTRIQVDVSGLAVGDMVRVADLAVPENVDVLADADTLVVNCRPPHVQHAEAAEAAPEAPAAAEAEAPASE